MGMEVLVVGKLGTRLGPGGSALFSVTSVIGNR